MLTSISRERGTLVVWLTSSSFKNKLEFVSGKALYIEHMRGREIYVEYCGKKSVVIGSVIPLARVTEL